MGSMLPSIAAPWILWVMNQVKNDILHMAWRLRPPPKWPALPPATREVGSIAMMFPRSHEWCHEDHEGRISNTINRYKQSYFVHTSGHFFPVQHRTMYTMYFRPTLDTLHTFKTWPVTANEEFVPKISTLSAWRFGSTSDRRFSGWFSLRRNICSSNILEVGMSQFRRNTRCSSSPNPNYEAFNLYLYRHTK
jgi:hypothetical protein